MSINYKKIKKYLMDIIEDSRKIEKILKETSEKDLMSDEIVRLALKYLVIEVAEAMANTLQHILAKHFGLAVKGYVDTIKRGFEKSIVSEDVFKSLKPFFDFRNSLIHRYWKVDDVTFIENLRSGYKDFFGFCEEIEIFLKKTEGENS